MQPAILHASWSLLIHIAEPAARALLLGCFAALAMAGLQVRTVRVKMLVWRGVLMAALAMPVLAWVAPPIRVPLPVPSFVALSTSAAVKSEESLTPSGALREAPRAAVPADTAAFTDSVGVHPVGASAKAGASISVLPAPAQPRRHYPWPAFLLAGYVGVAFLLLGRFLVGLRFGQRLERGANPVRDTAARRSLLACVRRSGLAAPPLLAECETVTVPLTLGVRHPLILLPTDWREWQAEEFEAVLAHELSHVARHDTLIQRVALIHRAVFWFSPLAWWLERHLADLAEQASDEAALAGGADRRRYAETLLGFFAALEASPERAWWQGVSMAKAGQAEERVDRILAWRGAMPNKLKKSLVIGLLAVAAPVVALTATLHTEMYTEYDEQQAAPPPAPAAPATPAASGVTPTIATGPAPQAPNVAPAPAVPGTLEVPAAPSVAPVAPGALAPAQRADIDELRVSRELSRAQEAQKRAEEALYAAKLQVASSATSQHMKEVRAAEAAYRDAVSKYEAGLQQLARQEQEARSAGHRIYGNYESGPRFVIVSKDTDSITMSGSEEDAEHARGLRSKIPGDFIWFERDEKSYIIRDQATVERARALWKPQEELGKKQEELGKQQELLGQTQENLGRQMEQVRVKIPDMTAQLQKLEAEMKQLSVGGGTMEQIGDLQSEIGELQSRIGEIQGDAGRQQAEIGRRQGELGRKQGELGRQQGELGRQQGELARKANRAMKDLLDDAVAKGTAQPEEAPK